MSKPTIVVLKGDQTGQELLDEAMRVIDPAITRVDVNFET
ncbi:MAG: isocitrate dehydrogenase, partial [Burkholderiales bacterium]|nr:isocitrate dehydrogenase [Anaerolineae bacterium]